MKDKLIELIINTPPTRLKAVGRMIGKTYTTASGIADHLLANGVVVIDTNAVSVKNRPLIAEYMGHPIDEVIDLIRAKEEGRIIEVPCKVGDTVWCIYNYAKPMEFQIKILTMSANHYSIYIETKNGVYKHYCDKCHVGKWVFFSREEAEKALAERSGNEKV